LVYQLEGKTNLH